jgi:hypothetical protein
MISEILVDWLKHAFITKFNHIRPSVYERYTDVLCRDLASGSAVGRRGARKHGYVDQSPLVARRLGFAALPLAVLSVLVGAQSLGLVMEGEVVWARRSAEEWARDGKWAGMALAFWVWCVCVACVAVDTSMMLVSVWW